MLKILGLTVTDIASGVKGLIKVFQEFRLLIYNVFCFWVTFIFLYLIYSIIQILFFVGNSAKLSPSDQRLASRLWDKALREITRL